MAQAKTQKKKSGNKHFTNPTRSDRKYKRAKRDAVPGKCGSSYCDRRNGCDPWK